MLRTSAPIRHTSPWLLMILAVLTVLASPATAGVTLSLAAVIFAAAAGFAVGHNALAGSSRERVIARRAAHAASRLTLEPMLDVERVYASFDEVVNLRCDGAIARLRAPNLR